MADRACCFAISMRVILTFDMCLQKLIASGIAWFMKAKTRANSSVSFGQNQWTEMHGGGTSLYPHCRPLGLYNTDLKQYKVKVECRPDNKKAVALLDAFVIESDTGGEMPSKDHVYDTCIQKLKDESETWYVNTLNILTIAIDQLYRFRECSIRHVVGVLSEGL